MSVGRARLGSPTVLAVQERLSLTMIPKGLRVRLHEHLLARRA
jgi:hypothetical protein